ncbi:sensor histidine kinase [Clostridium sp. YIM B02505]|uniref:Sensor histidine kinase n=1 Tax=Clostridium yunnanense TaxID=2800325 RepID=A0ABS1EKF8_9CLOT|nr:sensor histidine kinase [Clostridium yunnanense]MBK1809851.1 sensor histidine kinase [Clostridium yunnanense]
MNFNLLDKNKIRTAYFALSIKKRLIIYFILSIFIPTSIISLTVYNKSKNIISKKIDLSIEKNLDTISETMLQKIEIVDDISTLITYNSRILDMLSSPKDKSTVAIINEINELNKILDDYYLFGSSYVRGNELFPRIYMVDRQEYNQYNISDKVYDISNISDIDWYRCLPNEAFTIAGIDKIDSVNGNINTIKFARRLYRTDNVVNPYAALLTIDMRADYFDDILEKSKMTAGSSVFIIDDKKQPISKENVLVNDVIKNNDINLSGEGDSYHSYVENINGTKMLVSVKHIDKLKWNIVSISPVSELNSELTSFKEVMGLVILICTIIAVIAALVLSEDFSKPIAYMVKSMSNVKKGDFNVDLSYKRKDEFAFLISQYKDMMRQIEELIDKLYVSELRKNKAELKMKDAELKALLAQINPHFLYNTLDSINWLAIKHNVSDISSMVKNLSNFFRYSLNNGKNIISFSDEKIQVESYLQIQCAKFKKRLEYYIEFQPEINDCYTVKLILQPLVENAIMHGIEESGRAGFISIVGTVIDGEIEIKVSDNGLGADVDKLNKFLEDSSIKSKSLGIRNVNDRIKHFFGDDYGIKYYKNKNYGITAVLRLKIVKDVGDSNA